MSDLKAPESQFNSGSLGFVFHRNLSSQARESLGLLFFGEHSPSSLPPCPPPPVSHHGGQNSCVLEVTRQETTAVAMEVAAGIWHAAPAALPIPTATRSSLTALPHSAPTHSPTVALGLALLKWCQTRKKHLRKARVSVSSFYFYLQQNRWLYSSIFRDS